jgi:large subunit ribosomal protein L15
MGTKGQLKHSGQKMPVGFEGQTPLIKRTPKYKGKGFKGSSQRQLEVLSLTVLDKFFNEGEQVDLQSLREKGVISRFIKKVRVLNSGSLSKNLSFGEEIYLTSGVKKVLGM